MVRKHPEAFRVRHLPSKTTFGYWTTPERRSARVQNIDAVTRGQVRFSKSYEG